MAKHQTKGSVHQAHSPLLLNHSTSENDVLPSLAESKLTLSPLERSSFAIPALEKWNQYIESRVSSSVKEVKLAPDTADHYKRYARLWWDRVIEPQENLQSIPENILLARTDTYLRELGKKSPNTARSIRSLVVGSFLPWCIQEGLCTLAEKSLLCLSPLAWHRYKSPIVEKFLEHSSSTLSSLHLSNEEIHNLFRSLHHWVATRHLGYEGAKIKVDARPLLQSEIDCLESRYSSRSPSLWIVSNDYGLAQFIEGRRKPFPQQTATELFSAFATWVKNFLSRPQTAETEKFSSPSPSSSTLRAFAPKLPPPPLLDKATERRGKFSKLLQASLPLRDMLIDHLIQNHNLSLLDITLLHSHPKVEGEVQRNLEQYDEVRNQGLKELRLNPHSPQIPYFVSADGGSLLVTEEPVDIKKTISPEAILSEAMGLITHLIRTELLPFEVLRTMSFTELRELLLSEARSRKLVSSYARQLQVSALRFYSIAHEGPGWAFPAVDGEALTADE